ncbi:MAG: sodium:proton exchanger [Waddliaceae bacterium]|nr:sodium:proton exchanger [Waddliaceae bacterium]
MYIDPLIPVLVTTAFAIVLLSFLMRVFRQPHVIVYLCVGVVLGPHFLKVVVEQEALNRAGAFGVIFLLFFIGMEVSPKRLVENWVVSVLGTILQVLISVLATALLGYFLAWSFSQIVFFGFVTSLSSTAVVLKLLEDWKEIHTDVGQDVLGILIVQDLIVVPMFIILQFIGGTLPSTQEIFIQALGGVAVLSFAAWLIVKEEIHLPFIQQIEKDHEMQIFIALGICFGVAMLTGFLGLSAPLGAFLAGMIISTAKQTHWVCQSLSSFRTVFMALFFVSIGMMIDLSFIKQYIWQIFFLVLAATATNTLINAAILYVLGAPKGASLYGGSLLSQLGEFSFVIAALGLQMGIVGLTAYQITISVTALTLLMSPFWVAGTKYVTNISKEELHL